MATQARRRSIARAGSLIPAMNYALRLSANVASGWSKLSWADYSTPIADDDFPLRTRACFFFCNGKFMAPSDGKMFFDSLMKTHFVSPCATADSLEDFAETFAFDLLRPEYGLTLSVNVPGLCLCPDMEHQVLFRCRTQQSGLRFSYGLTRTCDKRPTHRG